MSLASFDCFFFHLLIFHYVGNLLVEVKVLLYASLTRKKKKRIHDLFLHHSIIFLPFDLLLWKQSFDVLIYTSILLASSKKILDRHAQLETEVYKFFSFSFVLT